jgi:hypothetical protein
VSPRSPYALYVLLRLAGAATYDDIIRSWQHLRKKKTAKKSVGKKVSGKRELIKPKGDARFVRRDGKGRIKESDDVGHSLK